MSYDLADMILEAGRNERPHPLTRVDGPRAVRPIYAISEYELRVLTDRIEAQAKRIAELEAALKRIDRANDSPFYFNEAVEVVLREVLGPSH